MTLDERIVFLFRSTESLHATAQELRAIVQEHTRQLEIDAENIRRLANIAQAHEHRLTNLEGEPE